MNEVEVTPFHVLSCTRTPIQCTHIFDSLLPSLQTNKDTSTKLTEFEIRYFHFQSTFDIFERIHAILFDIIKNDTKHNIHMAEKNYLSTYAQ